MARVLFGEKSDWEANILRTLDKAAYDYTFADIASTDIAAFDCVIPFSTADSAALRKLGAPAAAKAILAPRSAVDLCEDKFRFNTTVKKGAFGHLIPDMIEPAYVERERQSDSLYPFILKKKYDAWGMNSFVIKSLADMERHAEQIADPGFFCQAFVAGEEEVAAHLLVAGGEVVYHSNIVYKMPDDFSVRGKQAAPKSMHLDHDAVFIPQFAGILKEIGFDSGTCCFNYKMQEDRPMIFELNARFGGSLYMDINRYLGSYLAALQG